MNRRILIFVLFIVILSNHFVDCARRSGRRLRGGRTRGDFGGIGKGIGKMIQSWREGDEEQVEVVSGSQTAPQYNSRKFHEEMIKDDTWIIIGISVVVVLGIIIWLRLSVRPVEERIDRNRIRQRNAEMLATYAVTKAITEHGVHPSRARGDNYRIKLD